MSKGLTKEQRSGKKKIATILNIIFNFWSLNCFWCVWPRFITQFPLVGVDYLLVRNLLSLCGTLWRYGVCCQVWGEGGVVAASYFLPCQRGQDEEGCGVGRSLTKRTSGCSLVCSLLIREASRQVCMCTLWGFNMVSVARSAVTAVSWQPHTSYLASVDKMKKAVVWGDVWPREQPSPRMTAVCWCRELLVKFFCDFIFQGCTRLVLQKSYAFGKVGCKSVLFQILAFDYD